MMDTLEAYKSQRKRAARYVSDHNEDVWGGMLPVLDVILPNLKELSTVSLGIIDAPIKMVRGTVTAGRASAFAGNFLPILPDDSEFAAKWGTLYRSHTQVGIHDACVGLEYLGQYYIIEGHKRVSVLKAVGAPSVSIDVQRVIPPENANDTDTQIYKEFLSVDTRIPLHDMWFSVRGSFTELLNLAGVFDEQKPEDVLIDTYLDFRACYHELGLGSQPVTAGDALLAFSRVNGLPYKKDRSELLQDIKKLKKRISFIYSPLPHKTLNTFYGKYNQLAFVLGALAGSLSSVNRIGWSGDIFDETALESFFDGARMTNSKINIFGPDFAGQNVDIALTPYSGKERGPGFPGVFAQLVGLTVPHGYIGEYYAAISRDFGTFYNSTDPSLPDIHSVGLRPEHIELGLDTGFLKLHLNKPVLLPQTLKLVEILKNA